MLSRHAILLGKDLRRLCRDRVGVSRLKLRCILAAFQLGSRISRKRGSRVRISIGGLCLRLLTCLSMFEEGVKLGHLLGAVRHFLPMLRLTLLIGKLLDHCRVLLSRGLQLNRLNRLLAFDDRLLVYQLGDLLSELVGLLPVIGGGLFDLPVLRGDSLDFGQLPLRYSLPVLGLPLLIVELLQHGFILLTFRLQFSGRNQQFAFEDGLLIDHRCDSLPKLIEFLLVGGGICLLDLALTSSTRLDLGQVPLGGLLPVLCLLFLIGNLLQHGRILLARCVQLARLSRLLTLGNRSLGGERPELLSKLADLHLPIGGGLLDLALLRGDVLDISEFLLRRLLPVLCLPFLIGKLFCQRLVFLTGGLQLSCLGALLTVGDGFLIGQRS
jgi:hypothetical protein